MPNYGQRLRHARLALAVFMTPILMLFISFTVVYLVRRSFPGSDISSDAYVQTWIPVYLPWAVLLANTFVLLLSSVTIDLARRAITREAALHFRIPPPRRDQQLLHLHPHRHARNSSGGRDFSALICERRGRVGTPRRIPPHRSGHHRLVLAFHDRALDLHPRAVLIRGAVMTSIFASESVLTT
jgi:hypothetical protein